MKVSKQKPQDSNAIRTFMFIIMLVMCFVFTIVDSANARGGSSFQVKAPQAPSVPGNFGTSLPTSVAAPSAALSGGTAVGGKVGIPNQGGFSPSGVMMTPQAFFPDSDDIIAGPTGIVSTLGDKTGVSTSNLDKLSNKISSNNNDATPSPVNLGGSEAGSLQLSSSGAIELIAPGGYDNTRKRQTNVTQSDNAITRASAINTQKNNETKHVLDSIKHIEKADGYKLQNHYFDLSLSQLMMENLIDD